MRSVHDIAAYILDQRGPMPAVKLHKLLYYSQAWSLVWDDRLLFKARVEAWPHGPVTPAIYREHRSKYIVKEWLPGDKNKLDQDAVETVDAVLEYYGSRSSTWLSSLTHQENPWRDARGSLLPGQHGHSEIKPSAMAEYYSSLIL